MVKQEVTVIRSLNGKTPRIAESAFVSEAAYVVGDVEVGEGSGIWPGAIIRGDFSSIKVGNNTMIQDNAVVHAEVPMEIGDNVTVAAYSLVNKNVRHNAFVGGVPAKQIKR